MSREVVECMEKLMDGGLSRNESIMMLRLSGGQAAKLQSGIALNPLESRHAVASYLAFTRCARNWQG